MSLSEVERHAFRWLFCCPVTLKRTALSNLLDMSLDVLVANDEQCFVFEDRNGDHSSLHGTVEFVRQSGIIARFVPV